MDAGQLSRPRLLVTGGGGFCGEHACRYYASAGWDVTAVVRSMPLIREGDALGAAAAVEVCDLTSGAEVEAMVRRVRPDYVLHLAGMNAVGASWTHPAAVMESNVMGTVYLLEAVRRLGHSMSCRIVVAGSMLRCKLGEVESGLAPPHPYSLSKALQVVTAQSWAALYEMDIIVAEPSNLIGPGRSTGLCALIAKYAAEKECSTPTGIGLPEPFRLSSRTEQRDLLDVRDAMRAYELLLLHGRSGALYPVASGTMRTIGELAATFDRLASCTLQWAVGDSQAVSPQPIDASALKELGWSPLYSLEQSVLDTLDGARQALKEGK